MSAEVLRRAASLMRERAEAATKGPWTTDVGLIISNPGPNAKYVADCYDEPEASADDAKHVASWHPAVALAVADLLDEIASGELPLATTVASVAHAYLGEAS